MLNNAWLMPLFPLIAFVLLLGFGRRLRESSAIVGILATLAPLVMAVFAVVESVGGNQVHVAFEWLNIGDGVLTMGFQVDALNAMMLFVVSLVSFLVHVYSRGYMEGDERFHVFYAYLALFTFSMLALVISPNFLQLYIFWELVGLCSFLLVGFWYHKPEAKAAAKKAFIVTRIGDVGLFVAICLVFWQVGSLEYGDVFAAAESGTIAAGTLSVIAILIFVGAVGKSGQFPLHTWLPDAMEGPTPVSALIHAATMVAAGVYLVARVYPLIGASPLALDVIAFIGAFTAIFAASIGLVQNDIKRVLAYSTVSQLGFMMFALGSAGYVAGTFHLMTHAFFKALLFLAAGAVIYALHHEQDIRNMGGFWHRNKAVGWLFLIGCLSIAGIPPFSGYFSKEEILAAAYADGRFAVFTVGIVAAFFTAFYMFRLFFLVFTGENRSNHPDVKPVPLVMTAPMWALAALSVVAGWVHTPWNQGLGRWLTAEGSAVAALGDHSAPVWLPVLTVAVSLLGVALAWAMYVSRKLARDTFSRPLPGVYRTLLNKYYVDELYQYVIATPLRAVGYALQAVDRYVIAGLVAFLGRLSVAVGRGGTYVQNGQVQTYGLVTVAGVVLLLAGLMMGGYLQ